MDEQLEVLDQPLAPEQEPAAFDCTRAQAAVDRLDELSVLSADLGSEVRDLLDDRVRGPRCPEAVDERGGLVGAGSRATADCDWANAVTVCG